MSESYSNSNHGGESSSSSNYGSSKYSSSSYRKPASESVEDSYTYQQPAPTPSRSLSISQIRDFLRTTEKGIRDYCSREKVKIDYNEVTNLFKYIIVDHDETLIKNPTLQNILLCVNLHASQNPHSQKEIYNIISLSLKEQIKDEKRNTSQLKYW